MKLKFILTLSILLVLTIVTTMIFLLNTKKISRISFPNNQSTQNLTITLTEDGFTPNEITIKKGDTIKFVSTRDKEFWPASNLHPTHGIYPQFDPLQPIKPNLSWSFKFDKVGSWKYHDHLFPYYRGTIVVKE